MWCMVLVLLLFSYLFLVDVSMVIDGIWIIFFGDKKEIVVWVINMGEIFFLMQVWVDDGCV